MRDEPALYAWFLHREMLESLLDDGARSLLRRVTTTARRRTAGANDYARELEKWLQRHQVVSLQEALLRAECRPGLLVWTELAFHWSDVARERRAAHDGVDVRSWFHAPLTVGSGSRVLVHGTFNPERLTCSTANVELRDVREQYVLAQVASVDDDEVELRPIAIATRLLAPVGKRWGPEDWQHVQPRQVDQFRRVDWDDEAPVDVDPLRDLPEATVKRALAEIIGEGFVPKDWGGEQFDLWTTKLRIDGNDHTAAFLLKGPARFAPMTIAMLGKNGDQLQRLAATAAEVLVVQHCHRVRPEVVSLLRSLASDFRNIRRYMVIDGEATARLLRCHGYLR